MGLGVVGPVGQGLEELSGGFVLAPLPVQQPTQAVVAQGEDGLHGQSPPVGRLGLFHATRLVQGVGQIVVGPVGGGLVGHGRAPKAQLIPPVGVAVQGET